MIDSVQRFKIGKRRRDTTVGDTQAENSAVPARLRLDATLTMRARQGMEVGAILLAVAMLAGCANPGGPVSVIRTGPDGLRTFTWVSESDGTLHTCGPTLLEDHVAGNVAGNATDKIEPVWLVTGAGMRLSVIWPAGFSVRFEPEPVLYNEQGIVVARASEMADLDQVPWDSATGTYENPYIASGILFEGCYPFMTAR